MFEPVLAAIVLAACVLALLHMAIGPRRRQRVDAAALRLWFALRRSLRSAWHWRASRRKAADAAEAAIRRARSAEHLRVVPKPPQDKLH
jgi:hypothetical protein